MDRRTAAALAVVAGGLAVLLVGLDLAFNVEARLETERDGAWSTVAHSQGGSTYADEPFGRCATPHLRLTVDNGLPYSTSLRIHVFVDNASAQAADVLLDETWHLDSRSARQVEFTVPDAAFERPQDFPADVPVRPHVTVLVDGAFLGTCVEAS